MYGPTYNPATYHALQIGMWYSMDTSSDQSEMDAWLTKSNLCCQINPRYACSYCKMGLCEDCSELREKIKEVVARVRGNWSTILPGVKPCSNRTMGHGSTVFDGHLF